MGKRPMKSVLVLAQRSGGGKRKQPLKSVKLAQRSVSETRRKDGTLLKTADRRVRQHELFAKVKGRAGRVAVAKRTETRDKKTSRLKSGRTVVTEILTIKKVT